MITNIRRIPFGSFDEVFSAAGRLCDLPGHGYAEEEYFFDGTANVYSRAADGGKQVIARGAPYTSRFLVRRPEQAERFSGNIIVEIMNSTPGFDLDRSWIITRNQIMRAGDIYIGLMSKPNVIKTMQQFDPERYAPLAWPNPIPGGEQIPPEKRAFGTSPESQSGLFWDILMDTARLFRSGDEKNPLRAYVDGAAKPVKVLLMGWSQSGGYLLRYLKDFADTEGKDCVDGYFSMGSAASATPGLCQEDITGRDAADLMSAPKEELRPLNLDRPMIDMHTESDNQKIGSNLTRMENRQWYRIYDIAGPSHDTFYSEEEYYAADTCLKKIGRSMSYACADAHPNSFPYHFAYQAALKLLEDWVREGVAPMTVGTIPTDGALNNCKDTDGNSIGGWRLPQITLPVCAYYGNSTAGKNPGDFFNPVVYGREEPFPVAELKRRYSDLANYKALVAAETDRAIAAGLLLAADREEAIDRAVAKAAEYGLN